MIQGRNDIAYAGGQTTPGVIQMNDDGADIAHLASGPAIRQGLTKKMLSMRLQNLCASCGTSLVASMVCVELANATLTGIWGQ